MSFNIKEGQKGNAVATFTEADGVTSLPLPAGVVPVWAVDPSSSLSITPAADGMSADIVGGTGDGPFSLTATATYGDGDTAIATVGGTLVAPEDTTGTIAVTLS